MDTTVFGRDCLCMPRHKCVRKLVKEKRNYVLFADKRPPIMRCGSGGLSRESCLVRLLLARLRVIVNGK